MNKVPGRVSDELYDKVITPLNKNPEKYNHRYKVSMMHLIDSCSRGYITPGEVYEALKLGYYPEYLTIRPSKYQHLL